MCPHPDVNWDIKNRGLLKSHCYRSIAALQCCVSFCGTTKWIGYMYTYIPSFTEHWVEFPVLYRTFSLVIHFMKIKVLIAQLCLTLRDPMDCGLSGSSLHEILQARMLEWVAVPFSRGSLQPRDWTCVSCNAGRFFTIWATREASGYNRVKESWLNTGVKASMFKRGS